MGARPAHGRALTAVQHPELNAASIRYQPHQAIQRVDLADEMALAETADRGITGHGPDSRETVGHQGCARTHPRSGARGFAAGVAAADDDHVKRFLP